MKSKIKLIIVAIIVVLLAGLYSVVDKNISIYDTKIESSDFSSIELENGDSIVQEFSTNEKTLDGIAIKVLATGDVDNILLDYELRMKENDLVVAEGQTSLAELKNGKFFQFKFDQLSDCEGEEFVFALQVANSAEDDDITVYYTNGEEENTSLSHNNKSIDGTMVLRTVTHRFDLETFVVTVVFVLYIAFFMRWLSKMFK